MSSRLRWMPNWLTGPSLGQYMRIRPGDNIQGLRTASAEEATDEAPEGQELSSTKQMLKKHMVDSFFERALNQIAPSVAEGVEREAEIPLDIAAEIVNHDDSLVDVVSNEPIYEAELPLDDTFLDVEQDSYGDEIPEEHVLSQDFIDAGAGVSEHIDTPEVAVAPEKPVGYYIFAITLGQVEFVLPDLTIAEEYPLFVYPFAGAQAVLSEVPLDIFSEEALQAKLNNPSWFEQTLRTHTQILAQVQSQASIVPMRVCTICDSRQALESFLQEHHDDFVSTLELIEGNHAWRFSIFCNEPRLRTLTAKASNRVRAIQAEMAGKSKSDAQPLHEKLEGVLEEEARSVCKACVKHSHGTLSVISAENKVQSLKEEEAGDPHKREIFRCDYLVSVTTKAAFRKEIETLIESYKSLGFELEIEGPSSPAQFANRKVLPAGNRVASPQSADTLAVS